MNPIKYYLYYFHPYFPSLLFFSSPSLSKLVFRKGAPEVRQPSEGPQGPPMATASISTSLHLLHSPPLSLSSSISFSLIRFLPMFHNERLNHTNLPLVWLGMPRATWFMPVWWTLHSILLFKKMKEIKQQFEVANDFLLLHIKQKTKWTVNFNVTIC